MKKIILVLLIAAVPALCMGIDLSGGYFFDFSGTINPADRQMMENMLENYSNKTGILMKLVVVNHVKDNSEHSEVTLFAKEVFAVNFDQGKNCVLVVVAVGDRRMYIELSKAYENAYGTGLRDKMTKRMVKFFKDGNYSKGIYEGLRAVMFREDRFADIKSLLKRRWKLFAVPGLMIVIIASLIFGLSGKKGKGKKPAKESIDLSFGGGASGKW